MKNLYQKLHFSKSSTYGCLAFFSFGLMSVLPGASLIHVDIPVSEAKTTNTVTAEQGSKNTDEQCRLQADVALFFALQEQKIDNLQTTVPCEKESHVLAKTREGKDLSSDGELESTIETMVSGYPIEKMAPAIAKYDRSVAALIVGIAKKESNWGKRVPLDENGKDCFNYWGYKGAGSRGVAMGHGCFGSPEEAVTAIGDRLTELVTLRETSAPERMIIWKCGTSCKGHSSESVKKWIADVSLYYERIAIK